jgi:U3 small nucleolar RNA-associated protein 10
LIYRVHVYNTKFVLLTFLPYHQTLIFQNLLTILPANIPTEFKFLGPYLKTATNPPRDAVAYSATNTDSLFAALNNYALQICREGQQHEVLLSFWAVIATEAVAGRLGLAQSGRKELQRQRQEDVLLKVLPILNDGLSIRGVPELTLACYTLSIVLASKGNLADNVLDSLMDAVADTTSAESPTAALFCIYILCRHRSQWGVPKRSFTRIMRIVDVGLLLAQMAEHYELDEFVLALHKRSLLRFKENDFARRIAFSETLIRLQPLSENTRIQALTFTVERIGNIICDDPVNRVAKVHLLDMFRRLNGSEDFQEAIGKAILKSGMDSSKLETDLQMLVKATAGEEPQEETSMDIKPDVDFSRTDILGDLLSHIPLRTVDERSFLHHGPSHLFESLKDAFLTISQHKDGIQRFQSLPIWQGASDMTEPLFVSFLLCIAFGPFPGSARRSAIESGRLFFRSPELKVDGQALLPYATAMLADPDVRVRKETANLLLALDDVMPKDLVEGESGQRWGATDLYCPGSQYHKLGWLPSQDASKILRRVYLPVLEECVLDPTQIARALERALKGSSSSTRVNAKTESTDLKKPLRSSLFELLLSHITATPLYALKLRLLTILKNVDRVGSTSRTKYLLPVVRQWASLSAEDAQTSAEAAQVELSILEARMAAVFPSTDKDCIQNLLSLVTDKQTQHRSTFTSAIFEHMIKTLPLLTPERQATAIQTLFDRTIRGIDADHVDHSRYAKDVLLSVPTPTEALATILDEVHSSFARMRDHSPAAKRRRMSQNQMVAVSATNSEGMKSSIAMTTFALELVDNSKPEDRPQLLGPLFQLLAVLQSVKAQTKTELSYLLSLNLGSLLAIVQKASLSSKPHLDESAVRTELVIDCVRMTESPQVQNTALLLIAALCKIVPGRVLHNVMPIFTMMGAGVMRKDDEHSVYVIDQTIDLIIPPLIESLRAERRDVIVGTSELLASFVAAFDHIPSHRRLRLLGNLITKLGPEDFLYTIIAMLATRETNETTIHSSLAVLMNAFTVDIQLKTLQKYINLVSDALKPHPNQAQVLLSLKHNDPTMARQKVLTLLHALSHLLSTTALKAAVRDQSNVARIQKYLPKLLEQILDLTGQASGNMDLTAGVNACLTALLDLPSVFEYIDIVQECLRREDDQLRCKVLRLLEMRLRKIGTKDSATRRRAIAFLTPLADLLAGDSDINVKHASLACIDRVSEEFGRSDIPAISAVAQVIAGDSFLGDNNRRIKIMALLCLASMVEILTESIIPVIPNLVPKAFKLLQESMGEGEQDPELYNAVFSLLSGILSHVPFVFSDTYLDKILALCAESADAELGPDCDESRHEFLELLAKRLDLKTVIPSLQNNWPTAVEHNTRAIKENLETLSTAIERHNKSTVVKSAGLLSEYLLQALDFRRVQLTIRTEDSFSDKEVVEVEQSINTVAIKMIYKLNDTTFRPIFSRLVDWAIKCPGFRKESSERAQLLRKMSLFSFLAHFFGTLKSIVTSYASYILEPAIEVLKHISGFVSADDGEESTKMDMDRLDLWLATLSMLREAFTYDADAFFASPSHFDNLAPALISQLSLSISVNLSQHILSAAVPTVVALATAVVDNPAHLKTINHHICLLRRSESTAVRMASIKCQAALTESEELGTDWAENCIRAGEGLVYANEMLEDDDEDVVKEVRRWVLSVNEMLGEDILEA